MKLPKNVGSHAYRRPPPGESEWSCASLPEGGEALRVDVRFAALRCDKFRVS